MTTIVKIKLENEILRLTSELNEVETASEEHERIVKEIAQLTELVNEDTKSSRQMISDILKSASSFAATCFGTAVFLECFNNGLKFETEGVFSSSMVKNLGSHMSSLVKKVF